MASDTIHFRRGGKCRREHTSEDGRVGYRMQENGMYTFPGDNNLTGAYA